MLIEFQNYLTFQNIFLWTNFGIIPFWLLLIFMPNYKITQILINSIILPLILSSLYVYLVYQATLLDESIFDIFKLYLSLDNLYTVFATESFLLIFWIHFPKVIAFLSLVSIYFAGPIGLVIYWFFRVFFAKRLGFHD